jgi:uncharacterized protein (TIGR00251 family)
MASQSDGSITLRVQPRSSRDQVLGERGGAIAIKLKAPPVDGEANAALIRFVAKKLGVPPRDVQLVRGATSRTKWIRVEGCTAETVRAALLA